MSILFHSISTCSLVSKKVNLCIVGIIIYLIYLYTALLFSLIEPKKTISAIIRYSYILQIIFCKLFCIEKQIIRKQTCIVLGMVHTRR